MYLSRSASDASVPKTEDEIAADGDPSKTQPVKDPPAVLKKAQELMNATDENWYEHFSSALRGLFATKR